MGACGLGGEGLKRRRKSDGVQRREELITGAKGRSPRGSKDGISRKLGKERKELSCARPGCRCYDIREGTAPKGTCLAFFIWKLWGKDVTAPPSRAAGGKPTFGALTGEL